MTRVCSTVWDVLDDVVRRRCTHLPRPDRTAASLVPGCAFPALNSRPIEGWADRCSGSATRSACNRSAPRGTNPCRGRSVLQVGAAPVRRHSPLGKGLLVGDVSPMHEHDQGWGSWLNCAAAKVRIGSFEGISNASGMSVVSFISRHSSYFRLVPRGGIPASYLSSCFDLVTRRTSRSANCRTCF